MRWWPARRAELSRRVHLRNGVPDSLAVYAAFGLGRTVVEGRGPIDRFIIERKPPNQISSKEIARKESLIIPLPGGGERENRVAEENQLQPAISDETVRILVKWALALERYFKRPQEMEWAVDDAGSLLASSVKTIDCPGNRG